MRTTIPVVTPDSSQLLFFSFSRGQVIQCRQMVYLQNSSKAVPWKGTCRCLCGPISLATVQDFNTNPSLSVHSPLQNRQIACLQKLRTAAHRKGMSKCMYTNVLMQAISYKPVLGISSLWLSTQQKLECIQHCSSRKSSKHAVLLHCGKQHDKKA